MVSETSVLSGLAQWRPARTKNGRTIKLSEESRKRLDLFLPFRWPDAEIPVRWCIRSGATIEDQGTISNLEELDAELRSLPLTVFLDPFDTAILQATLPSMSRKNLLRALPYALEDHLLGDVEQQFFTLMQANKKSETVCIIAHDRMHAVLDTLKALGLHPRKMLPAISATPLLENTWTFVFAGQNGQDGQTGWFRTGSHSGMACGIEDLRPPYALKKSLSVANENGSAPTALLLVNAPDKVEAKEWSGELGLEILQPEGGFWENLAQEETEFNLLQGQYKQKSATENSLSRLRVGISLALVLLVGNLSVFGFDWYRLSKESRAIKSEMVEIFKQSFPEQASAIIDPVLQMQRNLDRLRQDKGGAQYTDFLALLSPVSKALHVMQAQNATVRKIHYSDKNVIVEVRLVDYQNLDHLKQAFNDNQLSVQVMQAESGTGGVEATLKLQARQET